MFCSTKIQIFLSCGEKESPYHRSKIKFKKESMWFYQVKILLEILFHDQIIFTRTYLHLIDLVHIFFVEKNSWT
eukprot:UN25968